MTPNDDHQGMRNDPTPPTPPKREGENPHSHNVSGYRTMSDREVDAINRTKEWERQVAQHLQILEAMSGDPRCIALAKTHMEAAFMYAVKAIAKPADPYR